ncbi:MAG: CPBP family intramembrane metalloprotease [Cyclobacteriaceae bacterium]
MTAETKQFKVISIFGLFFVLVVLTIFWMPSVYKAILSDNFEIRNYQMQGADWVVVLVIVCLIIFGEKNKLSSLNIRKLTTPTFSLGMALGGFSMLFIVFHKLAFNYFGTQTSFDQQSANPALSTVGPEFMYVYGLFSLITAGFAEEIIYRGYATERIQLLTQNKYIAFILPLLAFVLMHYRKGLDHLIIVLVVGGLMQWFYLKYRNLTINIIGHLLIDTLALIGIWFKQLQ